MENFIAMCERAKNLKDILDLARMADDPTAMWDRTTSVELVLEKAPSYIGDDVEKLVQLVNSFSTRRGKVMASEKLIADYEVTTLNQAHSLSTLTKCVGNCLDPKCGGCKICQIILEKIKAFVEPTNTTNIGDLAMMMKINLRQGGNKVSEIIDLSVVAAKNIGEAIVFSKAISTWSGTHNFLLKYLLKNGFSSEAEAIEIIKAANIEDASIEVLLEYVINLCKEKNLDIYLVLRNSGCFLFTLNDKLQELASKLGGIFGVDLSVEVVGV
jgi:hypothetical protein